MTAQESYAMFEAPTLPPVIVVEPTEKGWRGLTDDGQILNVESANGHAIEIPLGGSIAVTRAGQHVGYRVIPKIALSGIIDSYTRCYDTALRAVKAGQLDKALFAIETAMSFAPTLTARYNRGMILLELGRWQEGFENYAAAMEDETSPYMRSEYRACLERGLKRWRGEDLRGKRLLLIHDHGFGDSIMMLRYVPLLQAMGARVTLWLPPELRRLAAPLADVADEIVSADYFCSLLFLLQQLRQTPKTIPLHAYLPIEPLLLDKWQDVVGHNKRLAPGRKTVGVAWTPGRTHDGDYPRTIPLERLKQAMPDAALVSVQQQGADEADMLGVAHYEFQDFSDCAALMLCCDQIVTVDTAAVHLAGAVGHSRITLLLGHWASWRWLSPLYENICVFRQAPPGDWGNVLKLLR